MMQKNDNKNIILIGMPACGKSTIGVNLAKLAGYDFVDSDLLIQRREGKLLRELIREEGVDGFIAIENKVNRSIEVRHSVIATGGSAAGQSGIPGRGMPRRQYGGSPL